MGKSQLSSTVPEQIEATPRPWHIQLDAWERPEIVAVADSQAIQIWLRDHQDAADKTFRGVTVCSGFEPHYNGSGDEFGPHEIIPADEGAANARLIIEAVNNYDALRQHNQLLVEALEAIICRVCHNRIGFDGESQYRDYKKCSSCKAARAVLQQVKEK